MPLVDSHKALAPLYDGLPVIQATLPLWQYGLGVRRVDEQRVGWAGGAGAMRVTRVVGKPTTRCGRSMLRERPCSTNRLARGAEETLHSAQCRGRCVSARPCVDETTCDHCRVLRAPRPDRRDDKRALGGVTQSRSLPPMARAGGTTKETHAAQANGGAPSRASSSKRSGRASRGPRFVNCISSPRSWGCSSRWNPAAIM